MKDEIERASVNGALAILFVVGFMAFSAYAAYNIALTEIADDCNKLGRTHISGRAYTCTAIEDATP